MHKWQARGGGEFIAQMELAFDRRLDEHLLARAVGLLLDTAPILACRLVVDSSGPFWQRLPQGTPQPLMITDDGGAYARFRHSGLDATRGAQVALCLWRGGGGDRLLIKITHQVGDGGGLHMIAARLSDIYATLHREPEYRPPPAGETSRDVMDLLPRVPWPTILWTFVRFIASRWFPQRTCMLPLPDSSVGAWCFVERHLPASRVSLLSAYGRAQDATLNDMFVAAAYRALASRATWDGTSSLRILITVDLRRYLARSCEAVANLSAMDCPYLGRTLGGSVDETIANVRTVMHRRKQNWPGLAMVWLTYLGVRLERHGRHAADRRHRNARFRKITLSNTGPIDKARVAFAGRPPVSACILPPFRTLPGLLICLSGYDGSLTLSAGTSENGEALIGGFLDAMLSELPVEQFAPA